MNRTQIMDDFIKLIANISYYNPDLPINENMVYHQLIFWDIDDKDRNDQLNYFFPYWIDRFKNTPNIEVKNTENWNYFCQFNNDSSVEDFFIQDAIKMYIPLKVDYIYEGANMIFDFMAKENITHSSKIGSKVRMDDIVIRVYSLNDAQKVQKFIIENDYIRQGLLKPNPFALNDNLIAYASDGLISYNSEVCRFIAEYIVGLKSTNNLNTACLANFIEFINNKIEFYKSMKGIEELKNLEKLKSNSKKITNCLEVLELISIALQGDKNILDFINYYNILSNPQNKQSRFEKVEENLRQHAEYYFDLLFNAINVTARKYNNIQAIEALFKYVNEGDPNGFASDFSARDCINQLSYKNIEDICLKVLRKPLRSKQEITELVNAIILSKSNTEELPVINEIEFNNYLEKSCYELIKVYGKKQTADAIKYAIDKKSYDAFTRKNNARKNLKENIPVENVNSIVIQTLTSLGYDISCGYPNYLYLYVDYMCNTYGIEDFPKR